MPQKQDLRRVKTRKRLEKALMTLLKKKDLHEIKIKELTELAKINRITFYRHYETIEDLFQHCVQTTFAKVEEDRHDFMEENAPRDPENMILEMFRVFDRYREPLTLILSVNDKDLIIKNLLRQNENSYKHWGLLEYSPPDDSSFQYLYLQYEAGGLYVLLKEWLLKKNHLSPEQVARIYMQIKEKPFYQIPENPPSSSENEKSDS